MTSLTDALHYVSATEAVSIFNSGELSPVEILGAMLERAKYVNVLINPFAGKYYEQARANSKKTEARYIKGNTRELDGIPLAV